MGTNQGRLKPTVWPRWQGVGHGNFYECEGDLENYDLPVSQLQLETTFEHGWKVIKVTVTAFVVTTHGDVERRHCVGRTTRRFLRLTTAEAWTLGQEMIYEKDNDDGNG